MTINDFVEMTTFLCFFSICAKMQGFADDYGFFSQGKSPVDSADTLWFKNFVEIALSRTVSKINVFLHFTQKFKMAGHNGGKSIFGESRQ